LRFGLALLCFSLLEALDNRIVRGRPVIEEGFATFNVEADTAWQTS